MFFIRAFFSSHRHSAFHCLIKLLMVDIKHDTMFANNILKKCWKLSINKKKIKKKKCHVSIFFPNNHMVDIYIDMYTCVYWFQQNKLCFFYSV